VIELGGNITLVGFKEIEKAELVVVKKIVGSYARKMSDTVSGFENLTVSLKSVHKTASSEKHELHAKAMVNGKPITSETTERNMFVGLDSVLKKVLAMASK
jgi:ribosome-associated translation inhibitor RaiA